MFDGKYVWDSSNESPEHKKMLDAILARATLGTSKCESPGCDPEDNPASVGIHPALFAFRVTSKPKNRSDTYENYCDGCENADDESKNQNGCYMREVIFKGVLLCVCCTVAMVKLVREAHAEWIVRPFSKDPEVIMKIVPTQCKLATVDTMASLGNTDLLASTLTALGMNELGRGSVTSVHAIEMTPELQDALVRGDKAEVMRLLTPIISRQVADSIANDLMTKLKKRPNRKPAPPAPPPMTMDEAIEALDLLKGAEDKTLEQLGFQMPNEHKDN